jgi:hypothetical protein
MAVQRVTLNLVTTAALSWSFVVAIQILVGVGVIASAPSRRIRMARAVDLWFAGHLPYSLWILLAFAGIANYAHARAAWLLAATAVIPAGWTTIIAAAFCRTVLGTTARGARWRAAAHVVGIWAIGLSYAVWSAGGWFQLLP